jgi:hypothetical protein
MQVELMHPDYNPTRLQTQVIYPVSKQGCPSSSHELLLPRKSAALARP